VKRNEFSSFEKTEQHFIGSKRDLGDFSLRLEPLRLLAEMDSSRRLPLIMLGGV